MGKPQYGPAHQARRRAWDQQLTANGPIPCRRCNQLVHCDRQAALNWDHRPFDLGHTTSAADGDDGSDSQPEHARCNRAAGATDGNRRRLQPASREW